jgi:hypothetical protein
LRQVVGGARFYVVGSSARFGCNKIIAWVDDDGDARTLDVLFPTGLPARHSVTEATRDEGASSPPTETDSNSWETTDSDDEPAPEELTRHNYSEQAPDEETPDEDNTNVKGKGKERQTRIDSKDLGQSADPGEGS